MIHIPQEVKNQLCHRCLALWNAEFPLDENLNESWAADHLLEKLRPIMDLLCDKCQPKIMPWALGVAERALEEADEVLRKTEAKFGSKL